MDKKEQILSISDLFTLFTICYHPFVHFTDGNVKAPEPEGYN
jgi:hypothetical protein